MSLDTPLNRNAFINTLPLANLLPMTGGGVHGLEVELKNINEQNGYKYLK